MLHSNTSQIRRAKPLLGTIVEIAIFSTEDELLFLSNLATQGFSRIKEIQQKMSYFDKSSDICRLNSALPNIKISVVNETIEVLKLASQIYNDSDGAFDIMFRSRKNFPNAKIIFHETEHVSKTEDVEIDLGGIAKGYAVDECVRIFEKYSHLSGLINAGGDIRFFGEKSFPVSIRSPLFDGHYIDGGMFSNCAIATSVFENQGRPQSFSVISDSCMLADSLTKAVFRLDDIKRAKLLSVYSARCLVVDSSNSSAFYELGT